MFNLDTTAPHQRPRRRGEGRAHGASGARQRSGGVEKYSSIASRQAPEHGSTASLCGAGLEDQRRGLLGAVDADPGAEHPAARAVATRLVRCQSEVLAHHDLTLAASRRAVNRRSELNELRAELAELRALVTRGSSGDA